MSADHADQQVASEVNELVTRGKANLGSLAAVHLAVAGSARGIANDRYGDGVAANRPSDQRESAGYASASNRSSAPGYPYSLLWTWEHRAQVNSRATHAGASAKYLLRRAVHSFKRTYPLRSNALLSPIFIIGSGRSGNTLLRRIVMGHPDIYIPPETYVLGPCIRSYRRYQHLDWRTLSRLVLSMFALSEDFETFPTQSLHSLYKEIRKYPKEKRSLDNVLDGFYLFMAKHAKPSSKIWGDKTPINVNHLDEIDTVFPSARYIHIVRDGCDVVSSYLTMGRYQTIEAAARRWRDATIRCQEFGSKAPDRYLEIRYEDLVTRPKATTQKVFEFLGIDYHESMIDKPPRPEEFGDIGVLDHLNAAARPIFQDSIGKGRHKFTEEQLQEIQHLIGDQLLHLGYRAAKQ